MIGLIQHNSYAIVAKLQKKKQWIDETKMFSWVAIKIWRKIKNPIFKWNCTYKKLYNVFFSFLTLLTTAWKYEKIKNIKIEKSKSLNIWMKKLF